MASRRFPDSGSRYATRPNGDQASSGKITYFLDAAGQYKATVYAERGTAYPAPADIIVGSETHLDAFGGQIDFRGPLDGRRLLYASVNSGPIFRVPADPWPILEELEEQLANAIGRLTALEGSYGFSVDALHPAVLIADDSAPGLSFDGPVLVVDTDLAVGVSFDGPVLAVTY